MAAIPKNRITIFILRNLLYTAVLKAVQKEYDAIDIHYFSDTYFKFLSHYKKPYKITTWGSDFYRESKDWLERKRGVYLNAKNIQVETTTVLRDMTKYEPKLQDIIRVCNFGVDILEEIDQLQSEGNKERLIKCPEGSFVVTCGYNGTTAQQHLLIFEQIKKLPDTLKKRVYLCVPATYGLTDSYEEMLKEKLKEIGVEYVIIKNRLSETDLAKLRIETDVVINMQTSDSLSSSLLQHLYAGNVLLLGEWLPTDTYNEHGIIYQQVKEKTLTDKLETALKDIVKAKKQCEGNHDKIGAFATWKSVESRQYDIYQELLS